ncbi:thioredoxin-1 [Anaerolineaceae bacterium]|nr:thioredoxin-1 [Anaerolineaceae bacterium]GBL37753.1 thioredoxin-1 [Anaerolineaceae bacterium]
MSTSEVVHLTDAAFDKAVLKSTVPVLVDFWAPWCGPCRQIAPILDALATKYDGKIVVAKVNVDENQQYAGQYGIQGIPALLFFKGGQVVDKIVGAGPAKVYEQKIEAVLAAV